MKSEVQCGIYKKGAISFILFPTFDRYYRPEGHRNEIRT